MTLLAKIGAIILKVTQVVTGFGPILTGLRPDLAGPVAVVQSDLEQVAAVIANVEAVGQVLAIKGPDKLKAAAPLVAQVILQSSLLAHHKIANETLFASGAQKIADGMADVLNSLNASGVDGDSKT